MSLLWPPYVMGQTIIFLPCGFFLSICLSFFYSSPNLSGHRLDIYHTSTHGVALVPWELRMHPSNVLHAARWKYRTQEIAICAPSHNFLGLYLRNWGTYRQAEKLLNSNIRPMCLYNMVNFGTPRAEICWRVWGTPANFNGFVSLTARHSSSGRKPNFAALKRGRHIYFAGQPSRWALAHILVFFLSVFFPRLISAVADWMSAILPHMVWP